MIRSGCPILRRPFDARRSVACFLCAVAWLVASPTVAQCFDSATAACLQGDRYRVEMTWRDFAGAVGDGRVVPFGSDEAALFWFFGAGNWEVLVKVLDGCAINSHVWVFAAATTNVEYELVVTDETDGAAQRYRNPLGVPSPAITDVTAFPCTDPPDPGPDDPGDGALPTFASIGLYAETSPLNQPVGDDPTIDPDSDLLVGSLLAAAPLVIQVRQYSAPVFFADESTPRHEVELLCGPAWEMGVERMAGVPIPDGAMPSFDADGADNPPVGCGEDSDQDNHMVVLDLATRCEYDFWQMRRLDTAWAASWGAALPLDSPGIYPTGLSTRGSGFAFLGGLIWPDELAAAEIGHALVFSYPFSRAGGPVAPATESDGPSLRPDAIPEGARLQLDPALDLDLLDLEPWERTIAEALQRYGMFLVDTGGDSAIGLYAIDPKSADGNVYEGLLPDADFVELPGIPLERFRVLQLPPQDAGWRERLALPANRCVDYR